MTGQQIYGLHTLAGLVNAKRAVVVPRSHAWHKPRPAAVVINLSGSILLRLFERGMFVYEKDDIVDAEFNPKKGKK